MEKKEWGELLKYSSPYSILVVTWKGTLVELKCPFKVIAKYDVGNLKKGEQELVDKVKISSAMVTVFIIQDKAFYFYHFWILVEV